VLHLGQVLAAGRAGSQHALHEYGVAQRGVHETELHNGLECSDFAAGIDF